MKKRITVFLLIVALIAQMLPMTALASEKADAFYEVYFNIAPAQSQMEADFREWAASLVQYYRSTAYASLKPGESKSFTYDFVSTLELSHGKWNVSQEKVPFNGSNYAPYYLLGEKKKEFDHSTDAAAQNIFGRVTRYTYYTEIDLMDDPDKAKEIYQWLLIQTLKEKAQLEPDFLTGNANILPGDQAGWYSFDVSTGKMEYDPLLRDVDTISRVEAAQSILKAALSLTNVAFEGFQAYKEITGKADEIAKNAASTVRNEMNMDRLKEKLKKNMTEKIVDAVKDSLEELIDQYSESLVNEIQNSMREYLAMELSNELLRANKNVIGYLKTTYINEDSIPDLVKQGNFSHVRGFRDAAQEIISVLEYETMKNTSEDMIRKALQDVAIDMTGLKEVLPGNVIAYNAICKLINGLLSGTAASFQAYLEGMFDELINTKAGKKDGEYWKVLKDFVMTDLWNRIVKEGVVDGIKNGLEGHSPEEIDELGNLEFMSQVLADIWQGFLDGISMDTMDDYLINCAFNRGSEVVMKYIRNLGSNESEQTAGEKVQGKYEDLKFLEDTKVGWGKLVLCVLLIGMQDILFEIKGTNETYADHVLKAASFMSKEDQDMIKQYMKDFKKIVNGYLKHTESFDMKEVTKLASDFGIKWIAYLSWLSEANKRYEQDTVTVKTIVWDTLFECISDVKALDVGAIAGFMKGVVKNGELFKLISTAIAGIDIGANEKDAQTMIAYQRAYYNSDASDSDTMIDYMADTANEVLEYLETDENSVIGQTLLDAQEIASSVWDACFEFAGDFWEAKNKTENALSGENRVSMEAMRLYVAYMNSWMLERTLAPATVGGIRTGRYAISKDVADFDRGSVGEGSAENNSLKINMNADEIRDPELTPDLQNIKNLTDIILMQINLDIVGMGTYIQLLTKRTVNEDTRFYKKYLNKGVLVTDGYAESCMLNIRRALEFTDTYDPSWNALFAQ